MLRPGLLAADAGAAGETTMADHADYVHTGPGTPMGRVLRQFWQPIAVAGQVKPGKALPVKLLCEELTLSRGASGEPHLVGGRCAHRCTVLHIGWVEEEAIRCRYHGWKYDATGQCVEMPAEEPSFPPKVKIASYPTEEYLDIIFVYLGDDTPPPLPRFPELDDESEGVREVYTYTWPCN